MRVGIFGGSFNPPHIGHLIVCDYALKDVFLDKVLLLPSGDHPFKRQISLTKTHRLNMSRLLSQQRDFLEVCDFEAIREGISYTVDTLEELSKNSDDSFFFICGSDIIFGLTWWKNFRSLLKMVTIVCIPRAGTDNTKLLNEAERLNRDFGADIVLLDQRHPPEISSSLIRSDVEKFREYIGDDVFEYIKTNRLYDGECDED